MPIQPVITGSPSISTVKSKFGGSCLFFPCNSTSKLDYSNKGVLLHSDFTVEFFVNLSVPTTNSTFSSTIFFHNNIRIIFASGLYNNFKIRFYIYDNSGVNVLNREYYSTGWSSSKFYHLAITRSIEGVYSFFIDGIKKYDGFFDIVPDSLSPIYISDTVATNYFGDIYIDEFRIKNECIYNSDFSIPLFPFSSDLKTIYLSHFDGISGSQTFVDSSDIGVCDTPAASVPSGDYSGSFYVALSSITPESVIYYRIDSGDWIQSDLINIVSSCTVQVKAVRNNLQDSDILTLNYTVKCSPPVFNLDSGFYASAIQIVLSNNDEHNIYYKIGSGEWIQGDNILIDSACVVYAKCTDSGLQDSDIISRVFNFMTSGGSGGGTEIDLTELITSVDSLGGKIDNLNNNIGGLAASNNVIIRELNLS